MPSCWKFCVGRAEEDDTERVRVIDHSCQGLHDVPGHLFLHERTLEELILNSNRIEDLPLPLFHCHALSNLNLSQNMLSVIPNAISSLTSLKNLDLSRNYIEVIPDDLKKCKKLVALNLSVNPLTQFPGVVTKLISLEELYLNDIQLDYLPASTCRLINLRILELRENRLSNLPKAIARLTRLTRLDIGLNDFWAIPEVVGSLLALEELWVDLNFLHEIPKITGNLSKLRHFEAGDNCLISIHDYFSRCLNLVDLTLTGCKIEAFPENLVALTELVTLRLDRNKLKWLPYTIGRLCRLEELNVGHNNLQSLPASIGFLRKLTFLCVDNNCMEYLPIEIGSCGKLKVLSVQANRLKAIPAEVGNLCDLTVLDLRNNRLKNLPMSVLKLDYLSALWLSHNQSKPITPLVKEFDVRRNTNVLTCYLLPQEESCLNQASTSKKKYDDDVGSPPVCRITFADGSSDRPNLLIRAPTPYPRRLRELAKTARSVYPYQDEGHKEQVKPQGRQPKCDEIRTAIVKKNEVVPVLTYSSDEVSDNEDAEATVPYYVQRVAFTKTVTDSARISTTRVGIASNNSLLERCCEGTSDIQPPQKPPPYYIAAMYSKRAVKFALPSSNDGESALTDYKLPVHLQKDTNEVKNVPFHNTETKADNFEQIPVCSVLNSKTRKAITSANNRIADETLVDIYVASKPLYTIESDISNNELSIDDSPNQCKLNGTHENEENEYVYCQPLQENGSGSGPDLFQSDVSQLEEASVSNASGFSIQTTTSAVSYGKYRGNGENTHVLSSKSSPYENVTFDYSNIENSRFQIRKVKDTLPHISREKTVLKVKKRRSTKHKDEFLNFEWDFGNSDKTILKKLVGDTNSDKSTVCTGIKKHETALMCDSDKTSVNVPVPGPSRGPCSPRSFLFDVNGNSCNDALSKNSVNDTISEGSNAEIWHKNSLTKWTSKHSKTPWIFGQHKNPVVMQVEVPKLTVFNFGFTLEQKKSGLFINHVGSTEPICNIFKMGDKLIEIEGMNVTSVITVDMVYELMLNFNRSFSVLISRQT